MEQTTDLSGMGFTEGYVAVIDKPLHWTSADVVRKIQFALNKKGYKKIKVKPRRRDPWPRAYSSHA